MIECFNAFTSLIKKCKHVIQFQSILGALRNTIPDLIKAVKIHENPVHLLKRAAAYPEYRPVAR